MSCSLFFMVEGVSERVDTPTDPMRLRVGCSTVVIFCCRFGGDHANAAPVLSRRLTRRLTERTGEVGLARKLEGQRAALYREGGFVRRPLASWPSASTFP